MYNIIQRYSNFKTKSTFAVGGIRFYASNKEAVLKWCLNRADIAKTTSELKKMTGISKSFNMYKPMRPSQIMASEKRVAEVIRVLEDEYINPFGLGPDELLKLLSGDSVDAKLAKSILNVCKDGKKMRDEFIREFINSFALDP